MSSNSSGDKGIGINGRKLFHPGRDPHLLHFCDFFGFEETKDCFAILIYANFCGFFVPRRLINGLLISSGGEFMSLNKDLILDLCFGVEIDVS